MLNSVERKGVYKCGLIFEKLGFTFREQSIEDYGIDAIVETKDENYLLGKLIAIQIKSGDSYFKEIIDEKVVYRGDFKHYNYWINHSLPVIIVLYSPTEDKCIWEVIDKEKAKKCQSGWKIEIPINQILDNSVEELKRIANRQSEYERRLNSLVVAKDWILETLKYGESILEVEEWINKSSGRGKFTLKVLEKEEEIILYERELFGFGTRPYEDVIQDLFPWAQVNIDEEFYENNIDDEQLYKSQHSERERAFEWGVRGDKLLEFSDKLPKIYPYRNAINEVDFYRLKLTVNQIGKSFIEMDHFLETGNCYFIDNMDL